MALNEHDAIRELLPLAAAGALDEQEEKLLRTHLADCAECTAAFEEWRLLGRGLKRLPVPMASHGLVERTRAQMRAQLAEAAEQRTRPWVLGFLVLLSWTLTAATWPLLRLFSGSFSWLDLSYRSTWMALGIFTLAGWIAAAIVGVTYNRARTGRLVA